MLNEKEEELFNDRDLQQARLKRTLKLWNKLQDRIEETLDAKELSASMINTISKTLVEQFKMDKTRPEKTTREATPRKQTEHEENAEEDTYNYSELPFPIDLPTADLKEAELTVNEEEDEVISKSLQLPFPIDPSTADLEADLKEAELTIKESKGKHKSPMGWDISGRITVDD